MCKNFPVAAVPSLTLQTLHQQGTAVIIGGRSNCAWIGDHSVRDAFASQLLSSWRPEVEVSFVRILSLSIVLRVDSLLRILLLLSQVEHAKGSKMIGALHPPGSPDASKELHR